MENKIQEARNILKQIGMPLKHQNEICAYTLLALAGISPNSSWSEADMDTYRKFIKEIAWETEVWLADMPEHMIHMNGDRFMGPR